MKATPVAVTLGISPDAMSANARQLDQAIINRTIEAGGSIVCPICQGHVENPLVRRETGVL